MTPSDRIESARWTLERQLAWIGAAEIKVGALIAIDTAMMGALAAAYSAAPVATRTAWSILLAVVATVTACIAIGCAAMAILPRTKGPQHSFIYFGSIAKMSVSEFTDAYTQLDEIAALKDLLEQIHSNASIARRKFEWVVKSSKWSFAAAAPCAAAIWLLIKV